MNIPIISRNIQQNKFIDGKGDIPEIIAIFQPFRVSDFLEFEIATEHEVAGAV
ncbi:MAG: hypothetical protein PHV82_05100 [Victivallaceae bacterium]|nr:hypothetical protein [Victivallaceae bacterium]